MTYLDLNPYLVWLLGRGEWGMTATLTSELFFGSISRSVTAHTLWKQTRDICLSVATVKMTISYQIQIRWTILQKVAKNRLAPPHGVRRPPPWGKTAIFFKHKNTYVTRIGKNRQFVKTDVVQQLVLSELACFLVSGLSYLAPEYLN